MNRCTRYVFLFLVILFAGCANTKEMCKGFIGISTKVLEEGRKNALKKEFNCDLITCHNKIKAILKEKRAYIYCDDLEKDMLAIYVSEEDTTPVGIFLTQVGPATTLVEVTSPSTFGRETISGYIFGGLSRNLNPNPAKGKTDASQTAKEIR